MHANEVMTLDKLTKLLSIHSDKRVQFRLPNGSLVPSAFHITEVASVRKTLIDCGGRIHGEEVCQLQAWKGSDDDHRMAGAKLTKILDKGTALFSRDDISVEVEYEDGLISQYRVEGWRVEGEDLVLLLGYKHTDCRAKDICSTPATARGPSSLQQCCGGPTACAA
jgi:Family of unknown function (DUF6428)